jgi:hypothetical protein
MSSQPVKFLFFPRLLDNTDEGRILHIIKKTKCFITYQVGYYYNKDFKKGMQETIFEPIIKKKYNYDNEIQHSIFQLFCLDDGLTLDEVIYYYNN